MDSVTTRIVNKFQVTIPPEIREVFGLEVGDLLEWILDESSGAIHVVAKRAQLITPRMEKLAQESREARQKANAAGSQPVTAGEE